MSSHPPAPTTYFVDEDAEAEEGWGGPGTLPPVCPVSYPRVAQMIPFQGCRLLLKTRR